MGKRVEKIALVFSGVFSSMKLPGSVGGLASFCKVARGDVVATHIQRGIEQRSKFDMAIADDAGVGRESCLICRNKAVDDAAFEGLLKVEHMMGDADACGNGFGVGDIAVNFAHSRCRVGRRTGEAHGGAHTVISLLFEKEGGYTRVDAATHGNEYAPFGHLCSLYDAARKCGRKRREAHGVPRRCFS